MYVCMYTHAGFRGPGAIRAGTIEIMPMHSMMEPDFMSSILGGTACLTLLV